MAEKVCECKVLMVHYVCDKCGKGLMLPDYKNMTVFEIPHKCDNPECGHEQYFSTKYPYQKIVPIERLRDMTEEEKKLDPKE